MGEQHGVYLRNAALTLAAILPEIRTKGLLDYEVFGDATALSLQQITDGLQKNEGFKYNTEHKVG